MTNTTPNHPRQPDDNPERPSPQGTPRWVKIAGGTALAVAALIMLALIAGGDHGPGRHSLGMPADGTLLIQEHL